MCLHRLSNLYRFDEGAQLPGQGAQSPASEKLLLKALKDGFVAGARAVLCHTTEIPQYPEAQVPKLGLQA